MRFSSRQLTLALLLLIGIAAQAQQHELAITAGGNFPRNNQFDSGASFAVGGSYSGRLAAVPFAALYFELPVVVAPKSVLHLPSRTNYSSLFITPGLKVKFAPGFPMSPFIAAGVGFAHFAADATSTTGSDSHTTNVFDFGAGLDMKVFPYLSLRGEVRDFYSGSPGFSAITDNSRQHNIVAQTGLVFRF